MCGEKKNNSYTLHRSYIGDKAGEGGARIGLLFSCSYNMLKNLPYKELNPIM
jgi:hypothetical protein